MITDDYKAFIKGVLKDKSEAWLSSIDGKIERAKKKHQIEHIEWLPISYNVVFYGNSMKHGPVVVKINIPGEGFMNECTALKLLNGTVKIIDVDEEVYTLVIEKIEPGYDLWSLESNERIQIAAELIHQCPVSYDGNGFVHKIDQVQRIYDYIKKDKLHDELEEHLLYCMKHYHDLEDENNPMMLIHGDLHHSNILNQGHWTIIDPKGEIAYKSMEIGRFMNNEVGKHEDYVSIIDQMMTVFIKVLNMPKPLLMLSFYIDMVLSTAWFVESDIPVTEDRLQIIRYLRAQL